jgi:hypothetical protein
MVPLPKALNAFPDLFDNTGELMPKDNRRIHFSGTLVPVKNVDVRSAYAAGGYLDQHILRADFRQVFLPDLK